MIAKLFFPYYPEGDFSSGENDMSDDEYAQALLNQFGSGYNSFMDRALADASDSRYSMMEVMPEEYRISSVKDNGKLAYYQFDCEINDDEDNPLTEDLLDYICSNGDMSAFFVHLLVRRDADADAVSEMNYWMKDSMGIMNDPNIDEGHKVAMLPAKDLIVKIGGSQYVFSQARLIDRDNVNNFAIIVNNVKKQ